LTFAAARADGPKRPEGSASANSASSGTPRRAPRGQRRGPGRSGPASPPCTTFSAAGDQAGSALLEMLAELIRDLFAGRDTRGERMLKMAAELTGSEWSADLEPEKRTAKIERAVTSAALVAEPARYIHACGPEWVALEQVPAVLPLWQVYAA